MSALYFLVNGQMFKDSDRVSKYKFTITNNILHMTQIGDYEIDIKVNIENINFPCKLGDIIKFSK